MTQVAIKKERPVILAEKYFCVGLFVKDGSDDIFITTYDTDHEFMLLIGLDDGSRTVFTDDSYVDYYILEKGTVVEIIV